MDYCQVRACPFRAVREDLTAKLFRALGDPTRLKILKRLKEGPQRVVDLCEWVGRAQPNVSAHLALLKEIGLVVAEPRGRETFYSLATTHVGTLLAGANQLVDELGPDLCRCPEPSP